MTFLLRVCLASTPAFQVFGLDGSIKTVQVNEGTTIADASAMLKPKIFRGVPVEARGRLEREVDTCLIHARHTTLKTLSKVDPNELAVDWMSNGKKGALFTLEFCPPGTEAAPTTILPPPSREDRKLTRKYSLSSNKMPILNRNNAVSPPPSRSVANSDAGAPVAPLPLPPCSYFGNHILHVTLKDDSGNWVIPDVISQCIAQIRQYGLEQEGIFRISPSAAAVEKAKQDVDEGWPLVLNTSPDSVNLCCGILKQMLRELVEPLCTWGFYSPAIYVQRLQVPDATKVQYFQALTHLLPQPNSIIWGKMLDLFLEIEEKQEKNKMTPLNLSVVIGPSVCKMKDGDMMTEMKDMADLNGSFALMIGHAKMMRTPLERPFTACISGQQDDGEGAEYLKFLPGDFVLLREESAGTYTGLNMANGAEGIVLERAIQTRHMDLLVPVEPPPMDLTKGKKKKKERRDIHRETEREREERKRLEREKEERRKAKEEEKRQQKQEKQRIKDMRQAFEENQSPSALKDQLNNQIRLTTEMSHEVHALQCLVHDLSLELFRAMNTFEKETNKPLFEDNGDRLTPTQIQICKLIRNSLKTTPDTDFPPVALSLIREHFVNNPEALERSSSSSSSSSPPSPTSSPTVAPAIPPSFSPASPSSFSQATSLSPPPSRSRSPSPSPPPTRDLLRREKSHTSTSNLALGGTRLSGGTSPLNIPTGLPVASPSDSSPVSPSSPVAPSTPPRSSSPPPPSAFCPARAPASERDPDSGRGLAGAMRVSPRNRPGMAPPRPAPRNHSASSPQQPRKESPREGGNPRAAQVWQAVSLGEEREKR